MPEAFPTTSSDPKGRADSFHTGYPDVPAFDTTLIRLFNTANIGLEYVFAETEVASS